MPEARGYQGSTVGCKGASYERYANTGFSRVFWVFTGSFEGCIRATEQIANGTLPVGLKPLQLSSRGDFNLE